MLREEITIALEQGIIVESEDGKKQIAEENMCGGKYTCWAYDELGGWGIVKWTNNLDEAIEFVS